MRVILTCSETTIQENKEFLDASTLEFIFFPTLTFHPILKKSIKLGEYEWLCISSRKAFDFLLPLVQEEDFSGIKTAAVGEATADYLRKKGVHVDFVSTVFTGKDLAEAFCRRFPFLKGKILFPVSSAGLHHAGKILKKKGLAVDTIPLYKPVCPSYSPEEVKSLTQESFQGILFTSPSTWRNFKKIIGRGYSRHLLDKIIGVIGPTTANALKKDGFFDLVMPENYTLASLIKKIEGVQP